MPKSKKRWSPAWLGIVLGPGVLFSLALFLVLRGWERADLEERVASLVREQVDQLQVDILRSMEVLHSINALHVAEGRISREQFRRFVRGALRRHPEIQALSWNPVVPSSARSEIEIEAAADGVAGFEIRELDHTRKLVSAKPRLDYFPIYFIEPAEGNASALGYDLGSDARRRQSLEEARDQGAPVATGPIQLAQDRTHAAGILVLWPIYDGDSAPSTVAARRRQLAGFAVAVFRVSTLVAGRFQKLYDLGIQAGLYDQSPLGEPLFLSPPRRDSLAARRTALWLEAANHRWAVVFAPTPALVAAQPHTQSWLALASGVAFTFLVTAYLYSDRRRNAEISAANAALREEVAVRQRAEAAAAAANQAKSDFLASMSHEIRTPLNAILGHTQLLQRDARLSGEQRDAIVCIGASGEHLLCLINEILDLSKIEAGRMDLNLTDFDVPALGRGLAAIFQPLCARKRLAFRLSLECPRTCRAKGDEGKLRQVLINLLGNAVKFTSVGEVYLHFKPIDKDNWLFEVIDTGLGIPEEEQVEIFQPFHQGSNVRHQGGTGLGLAIAQRQVALLGGKLELQSERGVGSRFFFRLGLPASAPETDVEPVLPVPTRLKPGRPLRVLVVDDRKDNCDVLVRMLALVGCETIAAADGAAALRVAREFLPHIVFLDVLLPNEGGLAIARQLLADPAEGPPKIVAHTASPLAQYREEARAAGCVDFLSKPLRADQVYECLRVHLGAEFEDLPCNPIPETPPDWNSGPLNLPAELYMRLTTAAELHSTTALKASLLELRGHGPEAQRLAEAIRHLMRSYDMEGILRLIVCAVSPFDASPLAPAIVNAV